MKLDNNGEEKSSNLPNEEQRNFNVIPRKKGVL